jgi:cytochrome c peroxidase
MPGGVELHGGEQLLAGLDAARSYLENTAEADRKAGELVSDRVRTAAPKRTGYLRSTVGYELVTGGYDLVVAAPYAAKVEARKPYAHNTVEAALPDVVNIYAEHADEALAQI